MKDLDFDELDRAVSSLMTNVPKTTPRTEDEKVNTLDITPTLGDDAVPSFDKVEEVAAKAVDEPAEVPAPSTPAPVAATPAPAAHATAVHARPQSVTPASRRGGRFMDVVHPSADMKKPDAPRPVSRSGATIEPLNTQKIADIVPQKKAEERAVEKPATAEIPAPKEDAQPVFTSAAPTPVEETPKAEDPTPSSDWPDPLDMMTQHAPDEPKKEDESPKPEAEPIVADVAEEAEAIEVPAPLTSPFLPDAKVEKRPLGGATPDEDEPVEELSLAPTTENEEVKKTVNNPNDQLPADPTDVETHLPEEFHADLMAVEADTTHADAKPAVEKAPDPVVNQEETPVAVSAPVAKTAAEPVSTGPTSIPQQYREEPSTGDTDNGAIYDTDNYHQPLAHPAKKKPEWMWVIWIVVVLLLGAGAGAAIFLLKLV